jgi:cytosine/creatinine deaminase
MDFGLRCALAHGTGAIRTHLDSIGKQTAISWPVFAEMRQNWDGIIALQATSLFAIDSCSTTRTSSARSWRPPRATRAISAASPSPARPRASAPTPPSTASSRPPIREGLDLDFHVDESDLPEARTLERVAEAAIRNRFPNKLLCGHCCSASLLDDVDLSRLIDKVAQARIAVVSLPMCNMYLQDRESGRTPRWRGWRPCTSSRRRASR